MALVMSSKQQKPTSDEKECEKECERNQSVGGILRNVKSPRASGCRPAQKKDETDQQTQHSEKKKEAGMSRATHQSQNNESDRTQARRESDSE